MKIELEEDDIERITQRVVQQLAPLLKPLHKPNGSDILFTVESLAQYLHVSKQWVYERVHLNEIPYIKMKKFPRFKKSVIDKWLESMGTPAVQPTSRKLKIISKPNVVGEAKNRCNMQ